MDGCKAVFSKQSNLTVVDLRGDSSTRLYRILEDKSTAINPKLAQIKNNFVNDMTPTSAKPSAGRNASAKVPDTPKYPIPSSRPCGGIKSVAIVPVGVVETPQPIPCRIRTINKNIRLDTNASEPTEITNILNPNI